MNYDKLQKSIFELDSKVRFSGVANNRGELVAASNNENTESLLKDNEIKMSIHYTLQRWEKTTNLEYRIGKEKSAVIEYEKVTLITIPLSNNELLLISTEPDADYSKIVNKTIKLLKEYSD